LNVIITSLIFSILTPPSYT